MIAELAVWGMLACGPVFEIAKANETLELNLRAIEAFERGPFVLEATITNRGTKPLLVEGLELNGACRVRFPQWWSFEYRGNVDCWGVRRVPHIVARIRPGETYTDRYYLSRDFRSLYPAGTHEIRTHWQLWTITKRKLWIPKNEGGDEVFIDAPARLAAMPSKTFTVTISPATPANRLALAARLEAEFASLPPPSAKDSDLDGPFQTFCDRILYAPHPELIPLYFRALDRTDGRELFGRAAERNLVESIFAADPARAHRLFVDRLIAPQGDLHAYTAFYIWTQLTSEKMWPPYHLAECLWPETWFESEWWSSWVLGYLQALLQRRSSAQRRLPDAELLRLATAKDPDVRERVFNHFKNRLSDEWCDAYLKERAQRNKKP
jgi:hypothetical protein